MASQTLKIDGSFVYDPASIEWQTIAHEIVGSDGQLTLSKMRDAVLVFNKLTKAMWATWLAVCDDYPTVHTIYMPRRVDAAYTTGPELFSGTRIFSANSAQWQAGYAFHLLGQGHQAEGNVEGASVLVYMWISLKTTHIG